MKAYMRFFAHVQFLFRSNVALLLVFGKYLERRKVEGKVHLQDITVPQPIDHHPDNPRRENSQDYTFSASQERKVQILLFSIMMTTIH
jgi:hypothetical protein